MLCLRYVVKKRGRIEQEEKQWKKNLSKKKKGKKSGKKEEVNGGYSVGLIFDQINSFFFSSCCCYVNPIFGISVKYVCLYEWNMPSWHANETFVKKSIKNCACICNYVCL